jgi:hypothetical protein
LKLFRSSKIFLVFLPPGLRQVSWLMKKWDQQE